VRASWRSFATGGLWVLVTLAPATVAVAVLQNALGVPNASALYLVSVVLCGLAAGTGAAILAAVGAFLVYNYLFTDPLYTFSISDPEVLLSVVLLLFVGIVVGQLAALSRARAESARGREREARALFGVSRVLATRSSTDAALAQIAESLRDEAGMARIWVGFGPEPSSERVAADTSADPRRPLPSRLRVLQRTPGDQPARWSLVHDPARSARGADGVDTYRVRIEASGDHLGSIWAERPRDLGEPDLIQTRLLAAAADQIGQAVARDRVEEESRAAEIARQGEALKTSLLQSVSHDFRTPLAVIRAAAGSLDAEPALARDDRHASTQAIEHEVEYLDRLVANLLDLSRVEAGSLRADRDVYALDDALARPLQRARGRLAGRALEESVEPVPVLVDAVFLDAVVGNVLDNAIKYTPAAAHIRVTTGRPHDGVVRLTIDDDGPGVPDGALPHLFEKFYRVPGTRGGSRGGLGIGLAVVRGLAEAMDGRVAARRGERGGLAVDIDLPLAEQPPTDPGEAGA
jgi:two-component system, OmpR family, sensor histidine kinase KdpD